MSELGDSPRSGKKAVQLGIAAGCLALAGGVLYWWTAAQGGGVDVPTRAYFFDLANGQLFTADVAEIAPILGPSKEAGPGGAGTGVRARVFSCGKCSSSSAGDRWTGFYERVPPELKASLNAVKSGAVKPTSYADGIQGLMQRATRDREVARPDDTSNWFKTQSDEGVKLMSDAQNKCGDKPASECSPQS